MPSNTTNYNIPYPIGSDPANISGDMGTIAQYIDTTLATYFATNVKKITATDYDAIDRDFIISDSSLPTLIHLPNAPIEGAFIRIVNYGTALVSVDATQTLNGPTSILPQKGLMAIFTDGEWWCLPLSSSPADQPTGWQRPSDWIDVPELVQGEEVVYAIARVYEEYDNTFGLSAYNGYTIDWGDGTAVETILGGGNATHVYDYALLPQETLTTKGFKQALIEIRPISGEQLTNFWGAYEGTQVGCRFAEVKMTGPNLIDISADNRSFFDTYSLILKHSNNIDYIYISGNYDPSVIENLEMDLPNCTSFDWSLSYAYNLKRVILNTSSALTNVRAIFYTTPCDDTEIYISDTSLVTNFSDMFNSSLVDENNVPVMDTSSGIDFSSMFYWDAKIKKIPNWLDTSSATDVRSMFAYCANLEEIPSLNMSNVVLANSLARRCGRLSSSGIYGIKATHSYESCNLSSSALNTIYTNLGIVDPPAQVSSVTQIGGDLVFNLESPLNIGNAFYNHLSFQGFEPSSYNGQKYVYYNYQDNPYKIYTYGGYFGHYPPSQINLPTVLGSIGFGGTIDVSGNVGTSNDDPSIATAKGWTVVG